MSSSNNNFRGGVVSKRRPQSSSSTADDARSITQSLRRTQNLLQHELERVHNVSHAIESDSNILHSTKETHLTMKDSVKGANKALSQLERQKQKERFYFLLSVVFFYTVALYVLWTRIRIPFLLW